jgi:phosphoribosylformylglycinamidine synthase
MVLDVLLMARDQGLYSAVTDCGAGGFSSAVGEMGAEIGAEVWLERAPLKYEGLSYTEIWISEAQERMVLAVPETKWPRLEALCKSENVEAVVIGRYVPTGKLELQYHGTRVGQLDMHFLHEGRPKVERQATYKSSALPRTFNPQSAIRNPQSASETLLRLLSSLNIASKEWVIRQYDHEVQGGSVIKPLVGAANDGPSDAAVLRPVLSSRRGLVIACGMNPLYGDYDTYHMAACAIDEAVRNCVAVGADPARIAILDNFCWGYTDRPETLGALVRAALACYDVAVGLGTPFISGKDSLNNEFSYEVALGSPHAPREECHHAERDVHRGRQTIQIPHTLLISAMGQIADVRRCVTMDLKSPGNLLYQIGATKNELGGSHWELVHESRPLTPSGPEAAVGDASSKRSQSKHGSLTAHVPHGVRGLHSSRVPRVDVPTARRTFAAMHRAIHQGSVRACHDLSEGGLAVALAEMAFAGACGALIRLSDVPHSLGDPEADELDTVLLFSESASRFVVEVPADQRAAFEAQFRDANVPFAQIGEVTDSARVQIAASKGDGHQLPADWLIDLPIAVLKEAWQQPLRW